jgi:hypothetical protein
MAVAPGRHGLDYVSERHVLWFQFAGEFPEVVSVEAFFFPARQGFIVINSACSNTKQACRVTDAEGQRKCVWVNHFSGPPFRSGAELQTGELYAAKNGLRNRAEFIFKSCYMS